MKNVFQILIIATIIYSSVNNTYAKKRTSKAERRKQAIENRQEDILDTFDLNKDGQISPEEMLKMRAINKAEKINKQAITGIVQPTKVPHQTEVQFTESESAKSPTLAKLSLEQFKQFCLPTVLKTYRIGKDGIGPIVEYTPTFEGWEEKNVNLSGLRSIIILRTIEANRYLARLHNNPAEFIVDLAGKPITDGSARQVMLNDTRKICKRLLRHPLDIVI